MRKIFRVIVSLILLLPSLYGYAQNDAIYFNASWKKTIKDSASYYRTAEKQKGGGYFVKDHYLNGRVQMMGFNTCSSLEDSCDNGFFIYYDSLGYKELEGMVKNGRRYGAWKNYYAKDTALSDVSTYKNDTINGPFIEYDSLTHKIKRQGDIIKDTLIEYYSDGIRKHTETLKKVSGSITIILKDYYHNGALKFVRNYKKGVPFGTASVYDSLSHLLQTVEYGKESTLNKYTYYANTGNIKRTIVDLDSVLERSKSTYYDTITGKKILEGNYSKGERSGKWNGYYTSGTMSCNLNYKNDHFDGIELWYYKSGSISRKCIYKDGKMITGKCFNEKGKEIPYTDD